MATITASMVGELRAKTDAPMMECKKALTEAEGDFDKAEELLRVKLGSKAGKAASRVTAEGVVASCIEGNVGALIEVNCETDFVARTDGFKTLTQTLAKHIAMANPQFIKPEDIPATQLEELRKGFREEAIAGGKPENVLERIVEGKLEKYYQEACLLRQAYVLDDKIIIGDMLTQAITDLRENIVVRRFVRYELGGEAL